MRNMLAPSGYANIPEPCCGNCGAYMSRKAAEVHMRSKGYKPTPPRRKLYYGTPLQAICIYTGQYMNPALKAGCAFYISRNEGVQHVQE